MTDPAQPTADGEARTPAPENKRPTIDEALSRPPVVLTEGILGALCMVKDAESTLRRVIDEARNGAIGEGVDKREIAIANTALDDVVMRLHRGILSRGGAS
jgi:hypothetical protein